MSTINKDFRTNSTIDMLLQMKPELRQSEEMRKELDTANIFTEKVFEVKKEEEKKVEPPFPHLPVLPNINAPFANNLNLNFGRPAGDQDNNWRGGFFGGILNRWRNHE